VCFVDTLHVLPGAPCRSQPAMGAFETSTCEPTMGYCDTTGAPPTDPSSGTCKAYGAIGDACGAAMLAPCDPTTSVCDFMTQKCAALPGLGAMCTSQCASGLYCDSTGGGGATCAAQLPDGSSCMPGGNPRQCASNYCQLMAGTDGGLPTGTCVGLGGHGTYDVSPRSCGYGPNGSGPEDAGIQPPASGQSFKPWYE